MVVAGTGLGRSSDLRLYICALWDKAFVSELHLMGAAWSCDALEQSRSTGILPLS